MSEQPEMTKLKLVAKPEPEKEVPKPQVSLPPASPAGGSEASQTPPDLGVPPSPSQTSIPPVDPPGVQTSFAQIPAESSGGGLVKVIIAGVVALVLGLAVGGGGAYFLLSSGNKAALADMKEQLDKAKKDANARVAAAQQKVEEAEASVQQKSEEKINEAIQKMRQESSEQLARKDAEIAAANAAAKNAVAKVEASKNGILAQIAEMQQTTADAVAMADIERREKERLRHLAQQFQTEVKKYNPGFKPAPMPGQ